MESEQVESDKQFLSAAVTEALEELLREAFKTSDFNYKVQRAIGKGENYLGVVYRITANDRANSKKLRCIVKVPPTSQAQRDQFFARPCFLREILAYKEFLPMIDEFQRSKGFIPYDQRFHEYADSFCTLTEEFNETIIMEDLTEHGFRLFGRLKGLDEQHVGCVIRAYAKLHALSFAIKDQAPEKLEKFKRIVEILEQRRNDEGLRMYFETLKESALKSLCPTMHAKYYDILKQFFNNNAFFSLLLQYVGSMDCEPYAVIGHGDSWSNNFMFLYDRHGNVLDLCLIDWQLMRYASPAVDLTYFMFTSTTKEFRQNHYAEMIDIYYKELSDHLLRLGSNPEKVFPRNALEEQLKSKGLAGFLFALMTLPITTLNSEDTPDFTEISELIQSGDTADFKGTDFLGVKKTHASEERIRDVIIDVIDYGYLRND